MGKIIRTKRYYNFAQKISSVACCWCELNKLCLCAILRCVSRIGLCKTTISNRIARNAVAIHSNGAIAIQLLRLWLLMSRRKVEKRIKVSGLGGERVSECVIVPV